VVEEKPKRCPNDCFNTTGNGGHGHCDLESETCQCYYGYEGHDCAEAYCPNNCTITGTFKEGFCNDDEKSCYCYPGYKGIGCEELVNCPHNCTKINHGICLNNGKCNCRPEF